MKRTQKIYIYDIAECIEYVENYIDLLIKYFCNEIFRFRASRMRKKEAYLA